MYIDNYPLLYSIVLILNTKFSKWYNIGTNSPYTKKVLFTSILHNKNFTDAQKQVFIKVNNILHYIFNVKILK